MSPRQQLSVSNCVTLTDLAPGDHFPFITFFLPSLSGGGVERHFLKMMGHICEQEINVDLVLTEFSGERIFSIPDKVRVIHLESRNHRNQMAKNIALFSNYLRHCRPDIVHCATDRINVVAALAKFISKVDFKLIIAQVTSLDLQEISWFKPTKILHCIAVRVTYPLADAFITPSYAGAKELRKLPFMKKKPITSIHNPVLDEFTPDGGKKNYIIGDVPAIVAAGRLSLEKDYITLIKAFALLLKKRLCRLYILGEGAERVKIENLIDNLGIGSNVEMLGFVNNPIDYMQESDVFVLSSVKEGFGLVILEALVAGTKVVSTNCKHGPMEILKNGKYGRLVPIRNPQALAEAIYETLNEPERTEEQKEAL